VKKSRVLKAVMNFVWRRPRPRNWRVDSYSISRTSLVFVGLSLKIRGKYLKSLNWRVDIYVFRLVFAGCFSLIPRLYLQSGIYLNGEDFLNASIWRDKRTDICLTRILIMRDNYIKGCVPLAMLRLTIFQMAVNIENGRFTIKSSDKK
jgi:hypothetical protein